jgi:hypothetical protein
MLAACADCMSFASLRAGQENPFIAGEPVTADNEMYSLAIVDSSRFQRF